MDVWPDERSPLSIVNTTAAGNVAYAEVELISMYNSG